MKNIILSVFFLVLLCSCSDGDSNVFDSDEQNYTTNSIEQNGKTSSSSIETGANYYLVGTKTKIGTFTKSGFDTTTNIIGKYIENDEGISIRIDSVETLDTNTPHFKYFSVYGSSFKKTPEGKDMKSLYHIAFPIFKGSNYKPTVEDCPSETHICSSADFNVLFTCSSCEFVRDNNDCITGCNCAGSSWGQCEHSVKTTQSNLNKSLESYF